MTHNNSVFAGIVPPAPTREEFPPPADPMAVARKLQVEWGSSWAHWREEWMRWRGSHWSATDLADIRATLYQRLEHAYYLAWDAKAGATVEKDWAPSRPKIANVLEACAAVYQLDSAIEPPAWLGNVSTPPLIACTNGLLDPATRTLYQHSPAYFNLVSVPYAWDPSAPHPSGWLSFLSSCWPNDPESVLCLQQWFGYVLSGQTHLHKILLIRGVRRSGKGTIGRTLQQLVGVANTAGPTLASFGTNFGMSSLIGKTLGVIGDARLRGSDTHEVVERLLSISGEDTLTVDRKYHSAWIGRIAARLMILSNELPNFGDSSGTIVSRLTTLTMTISWLGREDTTLGAKLAIEMPGILNWALDGLDLLREGGRLVEPASSIAAMDDLADAVSPVSAFVRDCCHVGAEHSCAPHDLYLRWRSWCLANGRTEHHIGTIQNFARQMHAVMPELSVVKSNAARRYVGVAPKQVDLAQLLVTGSAN